MGVGVAGVWGLPRDFCMRRTTLSLEAWCIRKVDRSGRAVSEKSADMQDLRAWVHHAANVSEIFVYISLSNGLTIEAKYSTDPNVEKPPFL